MIYLKNYWVGVKQHHFLKCIKDESKTKNRAIYFKNSFNFSNIMHTFDVFEEQKHKSFMDSQYATGVLMMYLLETQQKIRDKPEILPETFKQFFKVCIA
jgi:hypothetical protein